MENKQPTKHRFVVMAEATQAAVSLQSAEWSAGFAAGRVHALDRLMTSVDEGGGVPVDVVAEERVQASALVRDARTRLEASAANAQQWIARLAQMED